MTLVIPTAVQIAIEMTCSGQSVYNVIGIDNDAGNTPAATLALVKTEWERANGPLKLHPDSLTMVGYHYTDLHTATGAVAFLGSTTAGGVVGPLSTMASSALIKLSSGTRSRSQQGRLYHGPLLESQINSDGRTLAAATLTALTTAYETFRVNVNAANMQWQILSRKNSSSVGVTSVSPSGIIATQRRRLR